jgi:hypothetical protein
MATIANCLIERDSDSLVSITKLIDKNIAKWLHISLLASG